jgi:ubiquinone/menaquinone biosynthesis C-methylase UbiE
MTTEPYGESLAQRYDAHRFGGKSGQFILQKDNEALHALLPATGGLLLDIPCGTGVYTAALSGNGHRPIAADASLPMLHLTGQAVVGVPRVLCDINHLPFRSDSFESIFTLRLFSHFLPQEVTVMLRELRRVLRPGGRLIFDTFRWSPRHWPLLRNFLEQSYIHVLSPEEVERLIAVVGLRKVDERWRYLFSPILQRRLPYAALRGLTFLENHVPPRWLLRTFWACTKP